MSSLSTAITSEKTALARRFRIAAGDYVSALEVARNGQLCVVGVGDGRILSLNMESGAILFAIAAHSGGVLGVCSSPDGQHFVSCGHEPIAKLWKADGTLLRELEGGGSTWVEHVAWAPQGNRIATASGKQARIWSDTGALLWESPALASTVTGLAFRSDGSGLAATCYGGVHIFPFVSSAKPRHLAWKGSLISITWSHDAKIIACGSQDNSVHFWRLASGRDAEMTGYPAKPKALAWDRESKLLATAGDSLITLWDFRGKGPEGSEPQQLQGHHRTCTQLAFSPRTTLLASGSQDAEVLLWDPRKRKAPLAHAFLDDEVTALVWHPSHHVILGADASGMVGAWEVP